MASRTAGVGRAALLSLLALTAAGCGGVEMIDVHNTATGQFARCEVPAGDSSLSAALLRNGSSRACPAELAEAGWVRAR
ncbi:hypothetical protein [Roseomonas populi]|uniref:SH3 domain-containing protein n=1 Tax=Roseomonas populi TaxID=3121582 RepID=A0ABT1X5J4_9PROT|nr:hypothetical protein [Roseomonas pecuniae]MCR0983377.1 hypothetical protein [Roseomonas pecuniae]